MLTFKHNEASSSKKFVKAYEKFHWSNKFLMMMVVVQLVPVFLCLELEVMIFISLSGLI